MEKTYDYQYSVNKGRTWTTIAVNLTSSDIMAIQRKQIEKGAVSLPGNILRIGGSMYRFI